ncbi:hypothetical protein [Streptomyces hokutonensis]|uniref:hypothetical protein n=1 Tax=Streptomyces hokutonensis TaxID=1306990 RepID=UPI003801475C
MWPLLDKITERQQDAPRAEFLRAQIEDLTVQMRETEQELEHLRITRKTVL